MAWELDTHMHGHVAPSVAAAAHGSDDPLAWLVEAREFQLDVHHGEVVDAGELAQLGTATLINVIAEHAIGVATTSNGGFEVWLDASGWRSVPWCDEDALLEWHG